MAACSVLLLLSFLALHRGEAALERADVEPVLHQQYLDAFAMQREGRHADAVAAYTRLLDASPAYSPAELNMGLALQSMGRGPEAVDAIVAAVKHGSASQRPDVIDLGWLALLRMSVQDPIAFTYPTLQAFLQDAADATRTKCADTHGIDMSQPAPPSPVCDCGVRPLPPPTPATPATPHTQPQGVTALLAWGGMNQRGDNSVAAIHAYRAVLWCTDATPEQRRASTQNSGTMYMAGKAPAMALDMFTRILNEAPAPEAEPHVAILWTQAARESQRWESFELVTDVVRHWLASPAVSDTPYDVVCGLVQPLMFLEGVTMADMLKVASGCAASRVPNTPLAFRLPRGSDAGDPRLRVAHLSSDFRFHPSATLSRGMFHHMPRTLATVSAYFPFPLHALSPASSRCGLPVPSHLPPVGSLVDARGDLHLFPSPAFVSASTWPHPTARAAAACDAFYVGDGVPDGVLGAHFAASADVLVDMSVNMVGSRAAVVAMRPVPIIVNYLGYPGTSGGPPLADYAVVDAFVHPPDAVEGFGEGLMYLPASYQANDQPWDAPLCGSADMAARAAARRRHGLPTSPHVVVLANLDSGRKFDPVVATAWAAIMARAPNTVLLLRSFPRSQDSLREVMAAAGVHPSRLFFKSYSRWTEPMEYFGSYCAVDLWVDTLWCAAHSTATDVLWSGAPLLALAGSTFQARVAASMLSALHPSAHALVVHSVKEYIDVAVSLARKPFLLDALRDVLVASSPSSPLFDTQALARSVAAGYQALWDVRAAQQHTDAWRRHHVVVGRRALHPPPRHADVAQLKADIANLPPDFSVQTRHHLAALNHSGVPDVVAARRRIDAYFRAVR